MQLSTRGRYAVMALIDLSLLLSDLENGMRAVKLEDIAKRQDISLSYLEQLFAQLRRAGVVESVRGPGGGYRLAREEDAIYIYDIIHAVNEGTKATRCDGITGCMPSGKCNAHHLWSALSDHIEDFMKAVSLKMARERNFMGNLNLVNQGNVNVRISG